MKLVSSLLILFCLCSCSRLDRRAEVIKVDTNAKNETQKLEDAKQGVLQTKQGLRIALLELRFSKPGRYQGKEVVLDSRHLYIYDETAQWSTPELAKLHGQILPELYTLFDNIRALNLPLTVLCRNRLDCELFKENMTPKLKKRTRFLHDNFVKGLIRVEPLMVISPDEPLFRDVENHSQFWQGWKKNWYQLGSSSPRLGPKDWALLLPSVNEF